MNAVQLSVMSIKAALKTVTTSRGRYISAAYLAPAVLLILSGGLRFYRLASDPLWFDEIYGYILGRYGIDAIFRNSYIDPHPPLYYLLHWLSAGAGSLHGELAWRWLPALSGTLTIPLLYWITRRPAGSLPAFLVAVLFAISPAHVYYSQEARFFAFITFLSALSALLVLGFLRPGRPEPPHSTRLWIGLALVSLVGLYSSYSYLMVLAIQWPFLFAAYHRNRSFWLITGFLAAGSLALISFRSALTGSSSLYTGDMFLNFGHLIRASLAGEPLRYGLSWAHTWLPLLLIPLAFAGGLAAFRCLPEDKSGLYLAAQVAIPLLAAFAIAGPVFGIRFPIYHSKVFLVLLPAFYALVAIGYREILYRLGRSLSLLLVSITATIVLAGSLFGLRDYWMTSKSPEGMAALYLQTRYSEGDVVISLNTSTNAAVAYYLSQADLYTYPQAQNGDYVLSHALGFPLISEGLSQSRSPTPLDELLQRPRLWLLAHTGSTSDFYQVLLERCSSELEAEFPPFKVHLMDSCGG